MQFYDLINTRGYSKMIKSGLGKISKILIFASIFVIFAMVGSASADSWTEEDLYLHSGDEKFGINMTMESAGDDVKWTVKLSDVPGIGEKGTSSGAQLIICNGTDSFLVGWNTGDNAHYKTFDGSWSSAMDVPPNMNVEISNDGKQFIITVPKSVLGGTGSTFNWAINVEADYDGTGGSDQQHFPDWEGWSDFTGDCYEDTVPSEPQKHDHWAGVPTANPVLLVGVLGIALALFMKRQQK
jgi:hypothetical protein